jgi:hypothetical protein
MMEAGSTYETPVDFIKVRGATVQKIAIFR